jgi:SAM-dependent methyltransferase
MRIRVAPQWLALREPADAAARSQELVELVLGSLSPVQRTVVHDLGCGTGSMARWLAPQLNRPQLWVAHDIDRDLLAIAAANRPDGVTVEAKTTDLARLRVGDVADANLITASALLDILTEEETAALVEACCGVGCPVLFTLSVIGEVEIAPAEPLDRRLAAAFDAHQRRVTSRGRLLGPDAVSFAVEEFRRRGREVVVRPSPWQLGTDHADLIAEWFAGWIAAACEQEPALSHECAPYRTRRLAQLTAGQLSVRVGHADLLALP